MSDTLTLTAPDDWHIHLRDGDALALTVAHAAHNFERVIVMPNLAPPVVNVDLALAYRERIRSAIPNGASLEPLMVLYLTDNTSPDVIEAAHNAGVVACKLYPAGATTNSDSGVTDIQRVDEALTAMANCGMKLLVHGEVTHSEVDIFDREAVFLDTQLGPLISRHPNLKVVLEHITTQNAVDFVNAHGSNVAATITAHHLLFNRNDMLAGGIRPHYYCLPILKRERHQRGLIEAATSGSPKFFLGTDSAPHTRLNKETDCGCAGAYTAYAPLSLYAEAFEAADALDKLEGFASHFGPDFYGLPRNTQQVLLRREAWSMPERFDFIEGDHLIPLCAGGRMRWKMEWLG